MTTAYKICTTNGKDRVLVTLQIPDDALSNINRKNIDDPIKAKYRTNKAIVVDIENAKSCHTLFSNKIIHYNVGDTIIIDDFDLDLENVCSRGIHFFIDKERALLYDIPIQSLPNGTHKDWYENGALQSLFTVYNGKLDGTYYKYYESGILQS